MLHCRGLKECKSDGADGRIEGVSGGETMTWDDSSGLQQACGEVHPES